ncbi:MAG: polar amino acid transport system substrate-binding protein [Actinomycetota bacterium]|jgi:polar amino acid transport system substrate-binding protein|nr:polar amino acid transport system substrate-binding protein [Actinomycetota bacterium]
MSTRIGLLALLLVGTSACVPASTQTNKVVHYDPAKTKMGEIQQRGHIVIGIPSDYFPLGYVTPSGKAAGFTAGLGKLVADALGVSVRYVARPSDRLLGLVDAGKADLVFPMIPITQDAAAAHPFTDPYLLAYQRLLVPRGSPIRGVADLGGKAVCSAIFRDTELPLTRLDPTVSLISVTHPARCAALLKSHRVAAATAPDVALLGLRRRLPGSQIVGDELTTEGYGAAASACAPGLAQFATRVFAVAKKNGQWARLYAKWVLPASGASAAPPPPTLTVIDAWDLFPPTGRAPSPTPVACPSP